MTFLKCPFTFGKIQLPNNIFYAPLAGCSDFPFRQMSSRYRPGLLYCEMVKMEALTRNDSGTFHILDYDKEMHPIGAQLCGSKPELAGQAARMLEEMGFDVIDLNCGCPVDKVTKDGSGSGLLKNPELIGEILANMVAAVKVPVTVKIRAGWDDKNIIAPRITEIAEAAGATAICIHGRTREQAYKGPANWDYIRDCKQAAKHILVIGNGDLFDGPSANKMFAHTGCDAVLVSRGTLGKPWIIEEMIAEIMGRPLEEKSLEECRQALLAHFECIAGYHPDRRAAIDIRRVGCWYLKKTQGTRTFRDLISKVDNIETAYQIIKEFPLGEAIAEAVENQQQEECCF